MAPPQSVIVTSGGTISRIDDVRHVGNFSEGTTGARIAEELLKRGAVVHYVHNKKAKRPFRAGLSVDPARPMEEQLAKVKGAYQEYNKLAPHLHEHPFETFEEYYELVKSLVVSADVIILAAAVSDYGARPTEGKISSDKPQLSIDLVKYPKVIAEIKQWRPQVFQVGFKLLSRSGIEELIDTAYRHGIKNHSNLTVANTLLGGDFSKRAVVLVTPEKGLIPVTTEELPEQLAQVVLQKASRQYYRTEITAGSGYRDTLNEDIEQFRVDVARLWRFNLFEPYYEGADKHFGFLARRVGRGGFLITTRGSNKEHLPLEDIAYVPWVDFKERIVHVQGRKASLNANVAARIFADRPEVQVILHAHVFPGLAHRTKVDYSPGTQEDVDESVSHLDAHPAVELHHHGLLAVGRTINELIASLDVEPVYTRFPELYDVVYARFQKTDDFRQLVRDRVPPEAEILDLCAGTGDLALGLKSAGYERLTLADKNIGMLKVARQKLGNVPCQVADLENLDLPGRYDAILVRQAINYLADDRRLLFGLQAIYRHLKPGGVLIFNAPNFSEGRAYPTRDLAYEAGGYRVRVREMNVVEGRSLSHTQRCILYKDDGTEIRRLYDLNHFGLYTRPQFASALQEAGFAAVEFRGKHGELTQDDRSLYAIARNEAGRR